MAAGGWGCPHEAGGRCGKVASRICDPGMKGCVLRGRFVFFNDETPTGPDTPAPASSPQDKPPTKSQSDL